MIETITKQQEKQIPKYIERFVKLAEKPTDRKKATKAVQDLYTSMGEDKPKVIFGESPFSTAMMASMYKASHNISQLDSQLHNQLHNHLDSQLHSQLNSQIHNQLNSQLNSQLGNQLDSQLASQLGNQLHSQLNSQIHSQLDSQLDSQFDSQLASQLNSQLGNQLHSQLHSQLGNQLNSQLHSQLANINKKWLLNFWCFSWAGWYSYGEYIGVKFDKKKYNLFMNYITNVSFIIPYKYIAFVSETPKKIHWQDGRLHNTKGLAVEYADDYGLYSIHGVKFTKEQFEKQKTVSITEIIGWEDIDQRSVLLRERPFEELLKEIPKKLIDSTKECGGYELYEIELPDIGKAKVMSYKSWSSDKTYAKFVPLNSMKCLDTIASLRHQSVEDLINSYKS